MLILQSNLTQSFCGRDKIKVTVTDKKKEFKRLVYVELGKEKANGEVRWTKLTKLRQQLTLKQITDINTRVRRMLTNAYIEATMD